MTVAENRRGTTAGEAPSTPALSAEGFGRVTRIALEEAGLSIPLSKLALVQSRLSKRMRVLGLSDFTSYIDLVSDRESRDERRELVSVLTTNVSSFFREKHHFDQFASAVLPGLADRLAARAGPVRLWSAGCSSGQEPYCLAMECLRAIPEAQEKDILILATDIDPAILERASAGRYSTAEASGVPEKDRRRFFTALPNGAGFTVNDDVRRMVRFRELNLHGPWPMRGQFDAIFCRNVLIYFDDAHQRKLWPRFHAALAPGGLLYLGHSERIHPLQGSGFASAGITIYRKT